MKTAGFKRQIMTGKGVARNPVDGVLEQHAVVLDGHVLVVQEP